MLMPIDKFIQHLSAVFSMSYIDPLPLPFSSTSVYVVTCSRKLDSGNVDPFAPRSVGYFFGRE